MQIKSTFLLIVIGLGLIFSCNVQSKKKEKEAQFKPRTNKIMMLAGDKMKKWNIDSYSINGTVLDDNAEYHHSGNSNIFFKDHRLEIVRDNKIEETGHWHFSEDSTEIEVSIGCNFFIYKLIEISQSEMQYMCVNKSDTIETIMKTQQL